MSDTVGAGVAPVWFFRLQSEEYERFLANTLAAAAFHDIGKANDGFQKVLTHSGDQTIRHEHLSGLLLSLPDLTSWLQNNSLLDFDIVLAGVISHHLKVDPDHWGQPLGIASSFRVLADKPDFATLLGNIGSVLHLPTPFQPSIPYLWSCQPSPYGYYFADLLEEAKTKAHRFGREIKKQPQRLSLLLAIKSALVAVDSAGSGVVRVGHNLESWIRAAFREPLTAADVHRKVIAPRIQDIEVKTGKTFVLQDFQKQASNLDNRALLLAPCGSGKTLAAWHWITARLEKKPATRVLFLYPTAERRQKDSAITFLGHLQKKQPWPTEQRRTTWKRCLRIQLTAAQRKILPLRIVYMLSDCGRNVSSAQPSINS